MRWLLAVLVLVSCACPTVPNGAQAFTPPSGYRLLWQQVEACSGRTGNFAAIHWFVVPNDALPDDAGVLRSGRWASGHTIYLIHDVVGHVDRPPPWGPWAMLRVKHEMLHDLAGPDHGPVFDTCGVRQ